MQENQLEQMEQWFPEGFVLVIRMGDRVKIACLHKNDKILYALTMHLNDLLTESEK